MASLANIDRRIKALESKTCIDDIPRVSVIRLVGINPNGSKGRCVEFPVHRQGE